MPVSVADLSSNRRTFTLETDAGGLRVTYRPYEMTPARESALARLADEARQNMIDDGVGKDTAETDTGMSRLISQFCTVVDSWDLVGPLTDQETGELIVEDGEPVAVTPRNLRSISSFFLVNVLNGIGKDVRPKAMRRDN